MQSQQGPPSPHLPNVPVQQGPVVQMHPQQAPLLQQGVVVPVQPVIVHAMQFGRQPVSEKYIKHTFKGVYSKLKKLSIKLKKN